MPEELTVRAGVGREIRPALIGTIQLRDSGCVEALTTHERGTNRWNPESEGGYTHITEAETTKRDSYSKVLRQSMQEAAHKLVELLSDMSKIKVILDRLGLRSLK